MLLRLRFIALAFLLTSCGVNHHLRKATKHLKKAEQLGAQVKSDTVWEVMDVPVPIIKKDTVVKVLSFKDTIAINQDKIITRIKYDTVSRTMFLESTCTPDTIKIKIPVVVKKQIKSPRGFWYYFRFITLALMAGFILGAMFWAALRAWIKSFL